VAFLRPAVAIPEIGGTDRRLGALAGALGVEHVSATRSEAVRHGAVRATRGRDGGVPYPSGGVVWGGRDPTVATVPRVVPEAALGTRVRPDALSGHHPAHSRRGAVRAAGGGRERGAPLHSGPAAAGARRCPPGARRRADRPQHGTGCGGS